MRLFSRLCVGLVLAMASLTLWSADEASAALTRTRDNLTRWSAKGKRLGLRQGRQVRAARRHQLDANHAIHAVDFEGGGFAITSAKDGSDKVIAFSGSGSFSAATNSPLWALLKRDVARRDAAPLTRKPLLAAAVPVEAPEQLDDLRVSPLVKTKWGQAYLSGVGPGGSDLLGFALNEKEERIPCYNYYTPKKYYTGCVATAMAQILHANKYPANSTAFAQNCSWMTYNSNWNVTGEGSTNLVVTVRPYNWDSMPLAPDVDSSEEGRRAISWVMHDCGAALGMSYSNGGSGANTVDVAEALTTRFGYANAKYLGFYPDMSDMDTFNKYFGKGGVMSEVRERAICSNLDAGYPVQLGIGWDHYEAGDLYPVSGDNAHSIVADGYGFSSGTLYTHLNMGWEGQSDVWYNLPEIAADYDDPTSGNYFNMIYSIVYNIFPDKTGEIVSGRVFGKDNSALAGVTVNAYQNNELKDSVVSNEKGIYALTVPAGEYRLEATIPGYVFTTNLTVVASMTVDEEYSECEQTYGRCGNIWGADLNLAVAETPSTEPDYIVIAPHNYVDLWKWYVEERAKLPGGQGHTFGVKDAKEIYEAYPYDKTYTDGKPRNPAESIHKWIGEQAKKGTKYFVLGGNWFDAQNLNSGDLQKQIPGVVTYPYWDRATAGPMSINPSDLYYACHYKDDDAKYVWDPNGDSVYVGLQEDEPDVFVNPKNFQPTVVIARMGFFDESENLSYETMVRNYVEKLKKGESDEFPGRDKYSVWSSFCVENDEITGYPDVYGVMSERLAAIEAARPLAHDNRHFVRMEGEDPLWASDIEELSSTDWEVFLPFGHGQPGAFAGLEGDVFANNANLMKFFMGNVPCFTGAVNSLGNCATMGLGNPKGGFLASINNTSFGWASPTGIRQRYLGVSDEIVDWCLDAYVKDGATAGEAWRKALHTYSGIVLDPETMEAKVEARDHVGFEYCIYAAIVEEMLFGDPLVKIDYSNEPPTPTVVATVYDGENTREFASLAEALEAAGELESARLTITGTVVSEENLEIPESVTLVIAEGASLKAPAMTINGCLRGPGTISGAITFGSWALIDCSNGAIKLSPGTTLTFAESEFTNESWVNIIAGVGSVVFDGATTLTNHPLVYRYASVDAYGKGDYVEPLNIVASDASGVRVTEASVFVYSLALYSVADAIAYVTDWELSLSDIVITDANVKLPTGYALKDKGDNTWGVYKQGKVPKVLFR